MFTYQIMNTSKYEEMILSKVKELGLNSLYSYLTFDPRNQFVFVPVKRLMAFQCHEFVKEDGWQIRKKIAKNIQAGKIKYLNMYELFVVVVHPCVDN